MSETVSCWGFLSLFCFCHKLVLAHFNTALFWIYSMLLLLNEMPDLSVLWKTLGHVRSYSPVFDPEQSESMLNIDVKHEGFPWQLRNSQLMCITTTKMSPSWLPAQMSYQEVYQSNLFLTKNSWMCFRKLKLTNKRNGKSLKNSLKNKYDFNSFKYETKLKIQ